MPLSLETSVLIIDDDPSMRELLEYEVSQLGIPVRLASSGTEALQLMEDETPSALLLDLGLPDLSGIEVMKRARNAQPGLPIVIVTATGDVETVVSCMQAGATDFIPKPLERHRLIASVRNAHDRGRMALKLVENHRELDGQVIGSSPGFREALALAKRAAGSDVTVLIEGESGTGKEVFAKLIHHHSTRGDQPFVVVNCGAIPEGLSESILFGHEKGAFTSAGRKHVGLFTQAHGGTLFLDEIGELPKETQVKLLRALQEGVVRPVGATTDQAFDVRIVAATNRVLRDEVRADRFREDLYYRLSVFPVRVPALRDRGDDALLLAEHFLSRATTRHRASARGFTSEALSALRRFQWPGNVRQLENVVERAVLLENGTEVTVDSLSDELVCALYEEPQAEPSHSTSQHRANEEPSHIVPMAEEEKRILLRALRITGWDVQAAAERLKISRATLYRRIRAYEIESDSNQN